MKNKKTFRYTVTFTVETSRKLKPEELEAMVADVWDDGASDKSKKLFVDSYGFTVEVAGEI